MRTCPRCGRAYPEVVGADEQLCPFCGHETRDAPRPIAREASASGEPIVDPVGALAHAGRFAARHYPRILLLWLPVALVDVAVALAITAYQERTGLLDVGSLSRDDALSLLGVAAPLYFLDFAVTFAAWSLLAAYVLDASDPARGASRARSLLKRLPGALAVGALMTFALTAGFVLAFVPFLVFLHLFLFAPAAFADGARVGEAFERSRRFARERETYGFTALVVLLLGGLVAVGFALSAAIPGWLASAGVSSPRAVAVVEVVPSWLLSPLLALLPASYWHLASREARSGLAEKGDLAGAAARTGTTKCPRCSTLIPYEVTGSPVDVTCPKCGTSGRVL